MKTPLEHLVHLRRSDFAPGAATAYSKDEFTILRRYGHWMQALTSGAIEPVTADQEQFLRVDRGLDAALTIYEHAWSKYKKSKKAATSPSRRRDPTRSADQPPVSSSYTDDVALAMLRSHVARGRILSSFADSLLRQLEERKSLSRKQLDCVHRLVQDAEDRKQNRTAREITGQSRKLGSHRWRG